MARKLVGRVTPGEREEIQFLFERRNGLHELAKILTDENASLYDKLVTDLGKTSSSFQAWWDAMSDKYKWENHPAGHWEIDFNTCDVYLVW